MSYVTFQLSVEVNEVHRLIDVPEGHKVVIG